MSISKRHLTTKSPYWMCEISFKVGHQFEFVLVCYIHIVSQNCSFSSCLSVLRCLFLSFTLKISDLEAFRMTASHSAFVLQ